MTDVAFAAQLSSDAGISVWRIVWVTTDYCMMGETRAGRCTYNVTLWPVRINTVANEKQQYVPSGLSLTHTYLSTVQLDVAMETQ